MTLPDRRVRDVAAELDHPFDNDPRCVTCGDNARRMRVLEVDDSRQLALCIDEQQCRQRIDTGIVGVVAPGDTLLAHAGTALVREPG
jgi:hypothetical protein